MPPNAFFETLPDGAPRGCSFTLTEAEHVLRHGMSILTIIKNVTLSKTESQASLLYGQSLAWLLDSFQTLSSLLPTWTTPLRVGLATVVQGALDLAEAHRTSDGIESTLYHKANATLTLVCADFCQTPSHFLADDEDGASLKHAFCCALIHLAKASADHEPTSRLVASGLLAYAQRLVLENPAVGSGTDLWVSPDVSVVHITPLLMWL